jgi:CRP/FNR family transcriptional regulator, dissimilatory nitrate respiration regulator
MSLFQELKAVAGFDQLPEGTIRRVEQSGTMRRFVKGKTLYRAGDPADGLYILMSGRVRVSRETSKRQYMLHSESAGGVLGELPVFGGGPFPATAVAAEPTTCLHLPLVVVERLLREDPAFARFALRRMALRAQSLLQRIDDLSASTITARVARYLIKRAAVPGEGSFTLGMSQEALATELGTAREVIVRALTALVDANAIERAGRSRFRVARLTTLLTIADVDHER